VCLKKTYLFTWVSELPCINVLASSRSVRNKTVYRVNINEDGNKKFSEQISAGTFLITVPFSRITAEKMSPKNSLCYGRKAYFTVLVGLIRSFVLLGGVYLHSAGMQHICSVHKAKYCCIKVISSGI